jgi:hypothetical protein
MVSNSLFCRTIFSRKSATFWDHAPLDAGGKPVSTFPHAALARGEDLFTFGRQLRHG